MERDFSTSSQNAGMGRLRIPDVAMAETATERNAIQFDSVDAHPADSGGRLMSVENKTYRGGGGFFYNTPGLRRSDAVNKDSWPIMAAAWAEQRLLDANQCIADGKEAVYGQQSAMRCTSAAQLGKMRRMLSKASLSSD